MESIQEILLLLGMGLLLLLGTAVTLAVGRVALVWAANFEKRYQSIDQMLIPFGQTLPGQTINAWAQQLHGQVDEPGDKLVVEALRLVTKILPQTSDMLTAQMVSEAFSQVTSGLVQLTDGLPVKPPESDEGVG